MVKLRALTVRRRVCVMFWAMAYRELPYRQQAQIVSIYRLAYARIFHYVALHIHIVQRGYHNGSSSLVYLSSGGAAG